jgi:hypothetical protein
MCYDTENMLTWGITQKILLFTVFYRKLELLMSWDNMCKNQIHGKFDLILKNYRPLDISYNLVSEGICLIEISDL